MKKLLQNVTYAGMALSLEDEVYQVDRRGCLVVDNPGHAQKLQALSGFRFIQDLSSEPSTAVSIARPGVSGILAVARQNGLSASDLRHAADLMDTEDRSLSLGSVSNLLPSGAPVPNGSRVYKQAAPTTMTETGVNQRVQKVINLQPAQREQRPVAPQTVPRLYKQAPPQPQVFHREIFQQNPASVATLPVQRTLRMPDVVPPNSATQIDPAMTARA